MHTCTWNAVLCFDACRPFVTWAVLYMGCTLDFAKAPDSQLLAAVELARQRLELFDDDMKDANRVAPKMKKKKAPSNLG